MLTVNRPDYLGRNLLDVYRLRSDEDGLYCISLHSLIAFVVVTVDI